MYDLSFIAVKIQELWAGFLAWTNQSKVQMCSCNECLITHYHPNWKRNFSQHRLQSSRQSIVYAIPCQKLLEVSANLLYIYEVKRPIYYIFYLKYLYKHSGTKPQLTLFGALARIQGACFGCWHSVVKNAQLYFGKKNQRYYYITQECSTYMGSGHFPVATQYVQQIPAHPHNQVPT